MSCPTGQILNNLPNGKTLCCPTGQKPYSPGTDNYFCITGLGAVGPIESVTDFTNTGTITVTKTNNSFIDLAYSVPFLASDADTYITSLVSKNLISNFQPTYFQVPYIYSAADNLINGKYTSSSTSDGNITITTYKIPYTGELKEETATIVAYYNKTTNILFYEIPREFSYNSLDQASIAFSQLTNGNFQGIVNIPSSFVSNVDNTDYELTFNISSTDVISDVNPIVPGQNVAPAFISTIGNKQTTCSPPTGKPKGASACNTAGYFPLINCTQPNQTNCVNGTSYNGKAPEGCCGTNPKIKPVLFQIPSSDAKCPYKYGYYGCEGVNGLLPKPKSGLI